MKRYLEPLSFTQPQTEPWGESETQLDRSPSIWVELAFLPNSFSHNQALLICRVSEDEWLAWIPDHGEAVLHVSEFYRTADWN
jgi:hypothetical protein